VRHSAFKLSSSLLCFRTSQGSSCSKTLPCSRVLYPICCLHSTLIGVSITISGVALIAFTLLGVPPLVARFGCVRVMRAALGGCLVSVILWPLLNYAAVQGAYVLWPFLSLVRAPTPRYCTAATYLPPPSSPSGCGILGSQAPPGFVPLSCLLLSVCDGCHCHRLPWTSSLTLCLWQVYMLRQGLGGCAFTSSMVRECPCTNLWRVLLFFFFFSILRSHSRSFTGAQGVPR
jgi:hypothetical protein